MAAPVPSDKVMDKEYLNWLKVTLALYYMKSGLHTFIKNEVDSLHQSLVQKIYGGSTVPLPPCTMCHASHVKRNKYTGIWTFRTQCKSYCDIWLYELLKLHTNPKSEKIYWNNSDVASWPFKPWECAKVFMPRGQPPSNVGPAECDAQAILTLLANCTYFHIRLSVQGLGLTHIISVLRNVLIHDGEMKLSDADRMRFIQQIIQLLEDPVCLKSLQDCKAVVDNIHKINNDSVDVFFNPEYEMRALRKKNRSDLGIHQKFTEATVESLKEELTMLRDQHVVSAKETKSKVEDLDAKYEQLTMLLLKLCKHDKIQEVKANTSEAANVKTVSSGLENEKQQLSKLDKEIQEVTASTSRATDQLSGENIELAVMSSMAYYTLKLELLKDGNKLHETESKIGAFLGKGRIVFEYDLTAICKECRSGSVIVYLQPQEKHTREALKYFCEHGGMKNFVLDLLKKKSIFSSLPEGEMSIYVKLYCFDEDNKSEVGQCRDYSQRIDQHSHSGIDSFKFADSPQVIKQNLSVQYDYMMEEIDPLQFKDTFVTRGILDAHFFEELGKLKRRQERAAHFLKTVSDKGNPALAAFVHALRKNGIDDLADRLCILEISSQFGGEDQVDDGLIEVVQEDSATSEESMLWSSHLKVAVRRDVTRTENHERSMANAEVCAIRLQESLVQSSTGESFQNELLESQDSEVCSKLRRTREEKNIFPKNPRGNQIIKLSDEQMEKLKGAQIGRGGFGKIYKAKPFKGIDLDCVIKEIELNYEVLRKSYDREVNSGRILHPFINPVIAYAESLTDESETGISYLMFPFMKNGDLRHNIDRENQGELLCPSEPNIIIWTRWIYQMVQAIDYLHNPVPSVRGPIFHRDITSRNIFLDGNFNVRIGDFGIAVEAKWSTNDATLTKNRLLGTEGYHPSNMNQKEYNASYDVFSVGVVMIEVLTGKEAKQGAGYLYEEYSTELGLLYLQQDVKQRSVTWRLLERPNQLAEIAIQAVTLDETKRKEINLLQKMEDLDLKGNERYRKPEKLDTCTSCCINPPANLSLKGKACAEHQSPCGPLCTPCLLNNHLNPLVCPEHGKTRPSLGDYVYGVFVAGNSVEDKKEPKKSGQKVAEVFIKDGEKIVEALTAKYPFILGANTKHLKVVKPATPGTNTQMEKDIKKSFQQSKDMIESTLVKKKLNPEQDRLPNSLFIFYFSGHCDAVDGLMLGSQTERMKASTKWIKKMIHNDLGVEKVLVILDCCYADSQNFADTEGLYSKKKSARRKTKASIYHLSSCGNLEETSIKTRRQGSYFTSLLCNGLKGFQRKISEDGRTEDCQECGGPVQYCDHCEKVVKDTLERMKGNHEKGLQGIDSMGSQDDPLKCCDHCKARKQPGTNIEVPCVQFHKKCIRKQCITVSSLQKFIQKHFEALGHNCNTVSNIQRNQDEFVLAYYNPIKPIISIYLKGSKNSDNSGQKAFCFPLDCLEQDIDLIKQGLIKYAEKNNVDCDVLKFHQSYGKTVEDSSHLVAIYPKYDNVDCRELTTLNSICNAWNTARDLEARVREYKEGLLNPTFKCPVVLREITKDLIRKSEANLSEDYLRISQDIIQIPVGKRQDTMKKILQMKDSAEHNKDFKDLMAHLFAILRIFQVPKVDEELPDLKKDDIEKWLQFVCHDGFSIVKIK